MQLDTEAISGAMAAGLDEAVPAAPDRHAITGSGFQGEEVSVDRIRRETLISIRDQMAAHHWSDAELAELVEPSLGIITGLPELLVRLEALRRVDLGAIPPA